MPVKSSFQSLSALSSGKRGRKAADWNREDYRLDSGELLNVTADVATACKMTADDVLAAAIDGWNGIDEKIKSKAIATLSLLRKRTAEANGHAKTDSGAYSIAGTVVGIAEDSEGNPYLAIGLANDDDDVSENDDVNDDDSDDDTTA